MKSASTRPNLVLILADDMGYSDIGCFGAEVSTPNLDAMAARGLRCTHMYNNARCCPSRASLLTGLYPHQAGVGLMVKDMGFPAYQGYLNDRCVTIAEALGGAGYRTAMSGKWHVGGGYGKTPEALKRAGTEGYPTPMDRGFDRFYGILEGAGNYYNPITLMEDGRWLDPAKEDHFYLTDQITEKAIEMIAETPEETPLFLYVSYNAPHWPLHAPPEVVDKYRGTYLDGWQAVRRKRYARQQAMGILDGAWPLSPQDPDAPDWDAVTDKDWEDARMAVYAAQVERMDVGIGRILSALADQGIADNTVVVFLSDNGGCAEELHETDAWLDHYVSTQRNGVPVRYGNDPSRLPGNEDTYMSYGLPWANVSNTPFRLYKHWIHQGGIASPMVVGWPEGIQAPGGIHHEPLHFIDILPTFLDLAGAAYPQAAGRVSKQPPEGESFASLLRGDVWHREKPIYWEHEGNAGMLDGKWKLVRKYPGAWELYDMAQDGTEQHDLSVQEPKRLVAMTAAYESWAERIGVVLPEKLVRPGKKA